MPLSKITPATGKGSTKPSAVFSPPCSKSRQAVCTPWVTSGRLRAKGAVLQTHTQKWAFSHMCLRTASGDKQCYCFCPSGAWCSGFVSDVFPTFASQPVWCLPTSPTPPEGDSENETWPNKSHFNSLPWPRPARNIAVLLSWAGMQGCLLH